MESSKLGPRKLNKRVIKILAETKEARELSDQTGIDREGELLPDPLEDYPPDSFLHVIKYRRAVKEQDEEEDEAERT